LSGYLLELQLAEQLREEGGPPLVAGGHRPKYSDSSTRSLISVWYSTCVSCSTVRQVDPSFAFMNARYSGAPGNRTLSATTTDPGCSQPRATIRSRSAR